jgi:hypothetical protein
MADLLVSDASDASLHIDRLYAHARAIRPISKDASDASEGAADEKKAAR